MGNHRDFLGEIVPLSAHKAPNEVVEIARIAIMIEASAT
jgi:hypothetical protein